MTEPRETVMGGQDLPGFVGDAVAAALAARPVTDLRDAIADALAPFVGQHDMYRAADHVLDEVPQVVAALAARPVTDLRDAIAELADNWRRKSAASPQDFADSVLKVLAVRPVTAQERIDAAEPAPCYIEDGRTVHRGGCGEGPCGDASPEPTPGGAK